jgi:hypothetical protein
MDLVNGIRRPADVHEWAALADVVPPAVEFVIALQGQPQLLLLDLDEQAVQLEVGTFDVGDVPELNGGLGVRGLQKVEDERKMRACVSRHAPDLNDR